MVFSSKLISLGDTCLYRAITVISRITHFTNLVQLEANPTIKHPYLSLRIKTINTVDRL